MSNIKQYLSIGLVYLFLNLFIFIFWWVVTDPGNYIWFSISKEKEILLESACSKLFLIKYYTWTVILNGTLAAIILLQSKRILSIFVIFLLIFFYIGCSVIFDSYIGKNYYSIFLNQVVSPDFLLEPVNDAGKNIGPYLLENIANNKSPQRLYAIRGLGEIRYVPSIETLAYILEDSSETISVRTECFNSLKKMKVTDSKRELENFSRIHEENSSDSLLLQTIRQIESNDLY
jgi:hypothetical protein